LKKRSKKLLHLGCRASLTGAAQNEQKFFGSFLKKNDFLPVNIPRQAATYSKVYSPTIGKIPM
jgi:hypothetical protein